MKKIRINCFFSAVLVLVALLLVCSCTANDDGQGGKQVRKEYRIAIVLPLSGNEDNHWERSITWALDNLNKALTEQRQIRVTAEWFDENQPDKKKLFSELAGREDICAIIGPLYSENADIAAQLCRPAGKVLIPATVSSEQIMRQYSNKNFLWCLTENDISQCEVLLTRALLKGAKSVSLLTSDEKYGDTFWDWFAFQARELKLEVKRIEKYNAEDMTRKLDRLLQENEEGHCLICIPQTREIAAQMNECRKKRTGHYPFLLFSDVAYIAPKNKSFEGMEGIVQAHDPQSGFHVAYEVKFGEQPEYGAAHFYDAITLAGLAILQTDLEPERTIDSSLRQIVASAEDEINTSSETGVYQAVQKLIARKPFHPTGASGKLYFDPTVFTNVIHSVYCHWQVYEGKHLILEYNTSDNSRRTDSSAANWNWKASQMQNFSGNAPADPLPKEDTYALIIATSSKWENYRHQANAYAVYQLLKKNGIKDDHILLISEDDIAKNPENPNFGFIQAPEGGQNLYEGVTVDYKPSALPFGELAGVVTGERNPSAPHPGSKDNLFVYWAGHGVSEGPMWLNQVIPTTEVHAFFKELSEKHCFRKLFFAMEACYSGRVGKSCEGIPGMLCLTAANEDETSKTSKTDVTGMLWISNSFTDALLKQLAAPQGKSIYDIYLNIYKQTIGSHVSVYNDSLFGNLYKTEISEFLYF